MRVLVIFAVLAFMWGAGVLAGVLWCTRDDEDVELIVSQDYKLGDDNNGRG